MRAQLADNLTLTARDAKSAGEASTAALSAELASAEALGRTLGVDRERLSAELYTQRYRL